jgi:hypothetical protein
VPQSPYNSSLVVGAGLSIIAALLHVACVFGGPSRYRFFAAGERKAAAPGSWYPTLLTLCITAILLGWAAYALSAAGALPELPLLKAGIVAITGVYSLRGLVLLPVLAFWPTQVTPFSCGVRSSVSATAWSICSGWCRSGPSCEHNGS